MQNNKFAKPARKNPKVDEWGKVKFKPALPNKPSISQNPFTKPQNFSHLNENNGEGGTRRTFGKHGGNKPFQRHNQRNGKFQKNDRDRVRFNAIARDAKPENPTPWLKFKDEFNHLKREEEQAAQQGNRDTKDAQNFLKQREINYRKMLMDQKRNETIKWEDFGEENENENSKLNKKANKRMNSDLGEEEAITAKKRKKNKDKSKTAVNTNDQPDEFQGNVAVKNKNNKSEVLKNEASNNVEFADLPDNAKVNQRKKDKKRKLESTNDNNIQLEESWENNNIQSTAVISDSPGTVSKKNIKKKNKNQNSAVEIATDGDMFGTEKVPDHQQVTSKKKKNKKEKCLDEGRENNYVDCSKNQCKSNEQAAKDNNDKDANSNQDFSDNAISKKKKKNKREANGLNEDTNMQSQDIIDLKAEDSIVQAEQLQNPNGPGKEKRKNKKNKSKALGAEVVTNDQNSKGQETPSNVAQTNGTQKSKAKRKKNKSKSLASSDNGQKTVEIRNAVNNPEMSFKQKDFFRKVLTKGICMKMGSNLKQRLNNRRNDIQKIISKTNKN